MIYDQLLYYYTAITSNSCFFFYSMVTVLFCSKKQYISHHKVRMYSVVMTARYVTRFIVWNSEVETLHMLFCNLPNKGR